MNRLLIDYFIQEEPFFLLSFAKQGFHRDLILSFPFAFPYLLAHLSSQVPGYIM